MRLALPTEEIFHEPKLLWLRNIHGKMMIKQATHTITAFITPSLENRLCKSKNTAYSIGKNIAIGRTNILAPSTSPENAK